MNCQLASQLSVVNPSIHPSIHPSALDNAAADRLSIDRPQSSPHPASSAEHTATILRLAFFVAFIVILVIVSVKVNQG